MTTDKYELYNKISLDTIIGHILDDLQNQAPPYFTESEKNILIEIKAYTMHITDQSQNNHRYDTVSIIENYAGELLDSICDSNRTYFETGIKTGVILLLQLLDL